MRLLFVSRDITHHLVPFFKCILNLYGHDNCIFAVTEHFEMRDKMGFPQYDEKWIFRVYKHTQDEYRNLWDKSDIIITRLWNEYDLVKTSLLKGKIVFYASERWFKPPVGIKRLFFPSYLKILFDFKRLSKHSNFFYLAMGYYAGWDFNRIGLCKGKTFNFGYFTPEYEFTHPVAQSSMKKLIWVGNMLDWKRTIDILVAYKDLSERYNISLKIIGEGDERKNLEEYVKRNNLLNVTFEKFLPNKDVKKELENADIYIMPSNGYEGWGAVVNEAMQTKCAVVSSEEIGSARSMIIDGKNGLLYHSGNIKELKQSISKLLNDNNLLNSIQEAGYKTITQEWSAQEAARRFNIVINCIREQKPIIHFENGPLKLIF